jgi:hypothetical protein
MADDASPTSTLGKLHPEHEDHPWTINIPDHPQRADSPIYVSSRKLMNEIVNQAKPNFICPEGPYQDHHGGGLWVKDEQGWMLLKNVAGMEWSQQFCADPAKVDVLRQHAQRLYARFPETIGAMKALAGDGYPLEQILTTEITTAEQVSAWVDSIFNASVPLNAHLHTGVLEPNGQADPKGQTIEGGVHHYPTPITDIQLFKYDDFQLWVVDSEGELAAVTPAGARGSGNGAVNVAYATPGTQLHKRWVKTHLADKHLQLDADSPMAKQAFAAQK